MAEHAGYARLENWQRWCLRGYAKDILRHYYPQRAAVCGNYLPEAGDVWEDDDILPVDDKDAEIVEKIIIAMPVQIKKAILCFYLHHPRFIGIPDETLKDLVRQGAARLVDKI